MKCRGKFNFRGITKKDGGEFKRGEETIKYNESYSIKLDENTDKGIMERTFKLPIDSPAVQQFQNLKLYQEIEIEFEVTIYSTRISLVPVAVINK